jgi:oligosaccharyltransferase complex subunit alpha (ribophorin I)
MEGNFKLVTLFLILAIALSCLATQETNININNLKREIYLKGKYVRITHELTLQNTGPRRTKQYLHMVNGNYSKNLFEVLAFTKGYLELPISFEKKDETGSLVYKVDLPYSIEVGSKVEIHILELYKNRLLPKPEKLPLSSDEQMVEFIDNLYALTAYPITAQEVIVAVPNINKLEYYTEKESTKVSKTQSIHYGPLLDSYKQQELRIHYEHAKPLIYFPKVERQILLSHLGHIAIDEHIELKNDAAALEGEFSRVKYNSLTNYRQAGHIFRSLTTQLPRKTFGLYYGDVIGNVSTSVATREVFFLD